MSNYCGISPIYSNVPSTPVISNNRAVLMEYWKKYLTQRAMSVYKWTMPRLWSENYFKYILYGIGYITVLYTGAYGWIPQRCALGGLNLFEEPDKIIVSNPLVYGIERKIGEGNVVFTFNADYTGVQDIIDYYAMQLAELSMTAYANMVGTKISHVFGVDNKKTADAMSKIIDQILNGEPAVVAKTTKAGEAIDYFGQDVKRTYIVSDILIDMRKILNDFNTCFGIPNANTEKKERLITDEVNANNSETKLLPELWLNNFKATCEQLNTIAGENLMGVDWADELKKEGD